jgi:hypothetical protein
MYDKRNWISERTNFKKKFKKIVLNKLRSDENEKMKESFGLKTDSY